MADTAEVIDRHPHMPCQTDFRQPDVKEVQDSFVAATKNPGGTVEHVVDVPHEKQVPFFAASDVHSNTWCHALCYVTLTLKLLESQRDGHRIRYVAAGRSHGQRLASSQSAPS